MAESLRGPTAAGRGGERGGLVELHAVVAVANDAHLGVTHGRLEGEVGFNQDLGSLTISGGGIQLAKVSTTNGQSYNGTAFISDDLVSTTSGSILFGNDIVLFGDANIVSAGGAGNNITITGGISSQTAGSENNIAFNSGLGDITITCWPRLSVSFAPSARASSWAPRQIANTGAPAASARVMASSACSP